MQTYALCQFLRELGHELEIIDIRQDENWKVPLYVKIPKVLIQERRIHQFMKHYYPPLTHRYYSFEEICADYPKADCYIVGSDQTWNPLISKDFYPAYFLDFGSKDTRRISYASSFGLKEWPIADNAATKHIKECLRSFTSLSVREQDGADLCKRTFGLEPNVVLDPTFLNDNYNNLVGKVRHRNELLCYKLNKTPDFFSNVFTIGETLNMPIALLNHNYPIKGIKYCFNTSTQQWLNRIAGAKYVFTDSFHGIAFSILFRKQFVATKNHNGRDSRLINLLELLNLKDRLYDSTEAIAKSREWLKPIDYNDVFNHLKPQIQKSRDYLIDALR